MSETINRNALSSFCIVGLQYCKVMGEVLSQQISGEAHLFASLE